MNNYRSFIQNNLVVLSGQLLFYAQGVILMPIIIKTIGVQVYGGYGVLISIVGFVLGISSLGVGFRRSRFLPSAQDSTARQILFYPQFYFHLISLILLSIGLMVIYPILEKIFFKGEVSFSIWLVVPYFIFYLLYGQTTDYFRYTHRIGCFNLSTLCNSLSNIVIILILFSISYQLTINALFVVQIISAILVAIPLTIKMIHEIGLRIILPSIKTLMEDIKLGFPLVMVYVVDFILSYADRFILTAFISITAVGYYNAAYALGSTIILFSKITAVVLPPLLAKTVDSGDTNEARTMVNYTVKGYLLLAIPFVVGSAMMSKPILVILANNEVANQAFMVTPIVALGILFYGLNVIISNVLFVKLKTVAIFKINIIAAIINVSFNLVVCYFIRNILVAAVSTLLSYLVAFIFIQRFMSIDWPIDYNYKMIIKSLAASVMMAYVLYGISTWLGDDALRLSYIIGEIIVGIVIYFLSILLLRTFSSEELAYLKKIMVKGDR